MNPTMPAFLARLLICVIACFCTASIATANGIQTRREAVVLYGTVASCSQPATVDFAKIQKKTPEWREIVAERVPRGSARFDLLVSGMNARIRQAVAAVAVAERRDCVVRKGDITNDGGLQVRNLTAAVIAELDAT